MPTAAELNDEAQALYDQYFAADTAYFDALKAEYGERAFEIEQRATATFPAHLQQLRDRRDELNRQWDVKAHEAHLAEKRERG